MADALRLFVVTWDPLEWLAPRPEAIATANAQPLDLVVYVPLSSLADIARRKHTTMAAVLAGLGGSAVTIAAAHEDAVMSGRYAELAAHGKVPDLLSGEPGPALSEVVIAAVSPEWEDVGLGAITDFVQQAFGPVDFDRSLVKLTATGVPLPRLPRLRGPPVKFPADLADSQGPHVPGPPERGGRADQAADGTGGGQQPGGMADDGGRVGAAVSAAPARRPGDEAQGRRK